MTPADQEHLDRLESMSAWALRILGLWAAVFVATGFFALGWWLS